MSGDQSDSEEDSADGQPPEGEAGEPPQQEGGAGQSQPQGQPPGAGGQPQGGAGGQPQGQPAAQQPQGGYQQGGARQPVQTGPSVGDIFSRLDTKNEMKVGIAAFTLIGVGAGLVTILSGLTSQGGLGFGFGVLIAVGSLAVTPALGGLFGLRQSDNLDDTPDTLAYATAAVTGAAGTVLLGIIVVIASAIAAGGGGGGGGAGQLFLALIFAAIGSAVAGAGTAWGARNLPSDGQGMTQPPQGAGAPPQGPPQGGAGGQSQTNRGGQGSHDR
ncbi:hypothetical protein [Salinirussus salinus]|uniref:hypothetical protein n=1 Tax=Salinirussus salinus TaxID=1198300 RepID=UPI00135A3670|nr:hypothetical protein [Salinirussus salinus]